MMPLRMGLLAWWVLGLCIMSGETHGQDVEGFFKKVARDSLNRIVDGGPQATPAARRPPGAGAGATASNTGQAGLNERAVSYAAQQHGQPMALRTADGWTLVVHRYAPRGGQAPGAMPVILCHGLTYNASFWDLEPSASLPRYLAGRGWDVWVVDLRGCGMSQKWVWKLEEAPEALLSSAVRKITGTRAPLAGFATMDPKSANWNLDHHIAYDVPAVVNFVKKQTGAAQVAWVGHSMGGIIALGHLARHGNPGIGRLVTVGSQVTMPNGQVPLQFLSEMIALRAEQLSGKVAGEVLMNQTKTSVHNLFFNQANVSPGIYEALGSWATDVPAMGLMQQYQTLANGGELLDAAKKFNYAKAVGQIQVPVLLMTGAGDQFAPPVAQKYLYENIGSTEKAMVVIGRRTGFAADNGHNDALLGFNSQAQVYPVIERWLAGVKSTAMAPAP
jgi:pimeloyl-ACP methyl ester carboxylesterase